MEYAFHIRKVLIFNFALTNLIILKTSYVLFKYIQILLANKISVITLSS